jgi:hypothetical protein
VRPHKLLIIADTYRQAEFAADIYSVVNWMYVSNPNQIMGLENVTFAFAGPCRSADAARAIDIAKWRVDGERANMLRLRIA